MVVMPVEVIVKIKTLDEIKEVVGKIKETREANPHEVIKTTIEIDLGN